MMNEMAAIWTIVSDFLKDEKITDTEVENFRKILLILDVDGELNSFEKIQLINLLKNAGADYLTQKKYIQAEKSYEAALVIATVFPIEQVKIYLKLNQVYTANLLFDKAIEVLKLAEEIILAHEIPENLQIECFQSISDYYLQQGNYSEITKYALQVVSLARRVGDGEYEAKALNTCAIPYAVRGEYKEAFEYMKAALEKAELLGLKKIVASTLVNIGNVFSALYNYEESIRNYKRVLKDYKTELVDISVGITYFNLGSAYLALEDFENAEISLKSALAIGEKLEHKLLISRVYFELVKIYLEKEDLETAIAYSFEAEKIYPKNGNQPAYETYLANQCMINLLREEYIEAIKNGENAIFYCIKEKNLKTLKRTYKAVAEAYKRLGNYKKAFEYLEQFSQTSEEFMMQMRKRRTMDLEIQYAIKNKETEIELLKQQIEIDKLKLLHQSEIESQNEKLKMSNQELRQFTYAISHDLKEPLRMISSFANLWYRKNKETNDKIDEEYFYFVRDGAERMTNMLQGLLDYATIGKTEMKKETVDLNKIVADIEMMLYFQIAENQVIIEKMNLPIVKTHQVLLSQLFQNLMSNAIKFKKNNVQPIVSITSKEEAKQLIIGIHDNGIGIAAQNIGTIFKIFKRLHTKEEYAGTGIGLSLCEKIVHHLGGKIWVESKLGEGSSFYFSLPK
jgi:signal transduction histidine kinase